MSYFEEIDAWLSDVLAFDPEVDETEDAWFDRVKKQIKEKLLESYRNGKKSGSKSVRPPREDKPRPNFPFRRAKR